MLPSRLATAQVLSYVSYKHLVVRLMRLLCKEAAKYVQQNEAILDSFWVDELSVNFNGVYFGLTPDEWSDKYTIIDIPSKKIVSSHYRLDKIEMIQFVYDLRLTMSDGEQYGT